MERPYRFLIEDISPNYRGFTNGKWGVWQFVWSMSLSLFWTVQL
jgi:hypothetical protein